MKILILILFSVFIAFGCSKNKTESPGDKTGTTESKTNSGSNTKDEGPLKFTEKPFLKTNNNCNPSDTCTYFKVDYLEASGKSKDKINSLLMSEVLANVSFGDSKYPSLQIAADSFMTSFVSFRKEVPEGAQFWYFEYFMSVDNQTPKIVSISGSNSSYMGGAHPNTYVTFLNINKETGDTVSLSNIFAAGFEKKLNALVDAKFRRMKGLKPGDNLMEKGDLFENKIEFNYNWSTTKEGGIMFYYNPYEIAAYVFGPTELVLTKQEIEGLLAADSPLK